MAKRKRPNVATRVLERAFKRAASQLDLPAPPSTETEHRSDTERSGATPNLPSTSMTSLKLPTSMCPTCGTCTTATPPAATASSDPRYFVCNWPCAFCRKPLSEYNSSLGSRFARLCLQCWADMKLGGSHV